MAYYQCGGKSDLENGTLITWKHDYVTSSHKPTLSLSHTATEDCYIMIQGGGFTGCAATANPAPSVYNYTITGGEVISKLTVPKSSSSPSSGLYISGQPIFGLVKLKKGETMTVSTTASAAATAGYSYIALFKVS